MKKRVLVIDDEPNMRHMLTAVLKKAGYAVTGAANGAEGLSRLENKDFDLILCDVRMPGMDGLAFLKQTADRGIQTTTIVMSAYGTIDTAVEAMKLGAADYISKPFKTDEIILKFRYGSQTKIRKVIIN